MSIPADRLVAEALAKSGLLWLSSPAGSAPVWHVAIDGVAYVVTGPGEQASPVHEGPTSVIVRAKESRARLATFEAGASVVTPDDDDWEAAANALKAGRLNAPAGDTLARWREHNTILRLVPDHARVVVGGRTLDAPAAPATPDTATPDASMPPLDASPSDLPEGAADSSGRRPASAERAARRESERAARADAAQPGPSPDDESGDAAGTTKVER